MLVPEGVLNISCLTWRQHGFYLHRAGAVKTLGCSAASVKVLYIGNGSLCVTFITWNLHRLKFRSMWGHLHILPSSLSLLSCPLTSSHSASRCRASSFWVISFLLLRNQPSKLGDLRKCLQTQENNNIMCCNSLVKHNSTWLQRFVINYPVMTLLCIYVPVESYPVSFQPGCELRSSFLQCLHKVLLDERSELWRTLPGADGLLERHQTGNIPLL